MEPLFLAVICGCNAELFREALHEVYIPPEEVLDIAELRLALISLVLKPAYRNLSPADFDYAYDLAKRLTRVNDAKQHFEQNREF
jgi:hypothetical protein